MRNCNHSINKFNNHDDDYVCVSNLISHWKNVHSIKRRRRSSSESEKKKKSEKKSFIDSSTIYSNHPQKPQTPHFIPPQWTTPFARSLPLIHFHFQFSSSCYPFSSLSCSCAVFDVVGFLDIYVVCYYCDLSCKNCCESSSHLIS